MRYSSFLILHIVIGIALCTDSVAQNNLVVNRQWIIPDDPPIGSIKSVAFLDDGTMGFVDPISQAVFITDSSASKLVRADVASCDPGMVFRPSRIYKYTIDSFIALSYSAPWAIFIDSSGKCIGILERDFRPPKSFCVTKEGFIGLYFKPTGLATLVRYDSNGNQVVENTKVPTDHPHFNSRSDFDGLVCTDDGSVFVSMAASNKILQYAPNMISLKRVIDLPPDGYIPVGDDVPFTADIKTLMKSFSLITDTKSIMMKMYQFDNSSLLLEFRNGKNEHIIQIINILSNIPQEVLTFKSSVAYQHVEKSQLFRMTLKTKSLVDMPNPNLSSYTIIK